MWNIDEVQFRAVSPLFANTLFFHRLCVSSEKRFRRFK